MFSQVQFRSLNGFEIVTLPGSVSPLMVMSSKGQFDFRLVVLSRELLDILFLEVQSITQDTPRVLTAIEVMVRGTTLMVRRETGGCRTPGPAVWETVERLGVGSSDVDVVLGHS
jgi:hypothetical protein